MKMNEGGIKYLPLFQNLQLHGFSKANKYKEQTSII